MDTDASKIQTPPQTTNNNDEDDKDSAEKKTSRPHSAHTFSTVKSIIENSDSSKQYRPWVTGDRWKELKKMVENASKEKKIFLIKGGGFPAIRCALLERGWTEKVDSLKPRTTAVYPFTTDGPNQDGLTCKSLSESDKLLKLKCERMIMHKFLEHQPVDFLWTTKRDKYDWLLVKKDVMISRFCRSNFTSKEGLCAALNQMYWYTEPGVANIMFPRCYNLHSQEQMEEFIDDFRLTACMGLLKWFVSAYSKCEPHELCCPNGKVPFSALEFSIERITEYITFVCHNDIDEVDDKSKHIWEHEWDQFLTYHYLLIHENALFLEEETVCISTLEQQACKVLLDVSKYWPQIDLDGVMNIWIIKPGNKCRGRGIQLMNNIKDIVGVVNFPMTAKTRFVVQKYIENPLIIYNTKFDIRQWFLITSAQPLTIWMYKDSYLRFSSQLFNLNNYHESVHLTNNAVQSKYKNNNQRDKALPDENMWDCHTFKTYLRQIGKSDIWDDRIYPGMRECLIGTMLACQDSMDRRPNSFELYGADFMLTEDFTPWLIEINSSPDLAPTTSVTARLCPQCLEDVIKVVVDRKTNPDANTGMFELVYKQIVPRAPAYLGLTLSVSGKKIFKKVKAERPKVERDITPVIAKVKQEDEPNNNVRASSAKSQATSIPELLAWLQPYNSDTNANDTKKSMPTVHHALTVVKSGLLMKTSNKKRKSTSYSSLRIRNSKKDKNPNAKSKSSATGKYCHHSDAELTSSTYKEWKKGAKIQEKSAVEKLYWQDPTVVKSVGNKRCYIEPATWERDTASILRSRSSSVLQQNVKKVDSKHSLQVTPRVFSPGIVTHKKSKAGYKYGDVEASKQHSGFSLNIKKFMGRKDNKNNNQETENQSKKINTVTEC